MHVDLVAVIAVMTQATGAARAILKTLTISPEFNDKTKGGIERQDA